MKAPAGLEVGNRGVEWLSSGWTACRSEGSTVNTLPAQAEQPASRLAQTDANTPTHMCCPYPCPSYALQAAGRLQDAQRFLEQAERYKAALRAEEERYTLATYRKNNPVHAIPQDLGGLDGELSLAHTRSCERYSYSYDKVAALHLVASDAQPLWLATGGEASRVHGSATHIVSSEGKRQAEVGAA